MSGVFSFPPPPPPPPKTSPIQQGHTQDDQGRGRGRGRGDRGGSSAQHGRGQSSTRGSNYSSNNQSQSNPGQYGNRQAEFSRNGFNTTPYGSHDVSSQSHHAAQTQHMTIGAFTNPGSSGHNFYSNVQSQEYSFPQHLSNANSQSPPNDPFLPRTTAGHKRKLDALRGVPREKKPGPQTAPSVPSFGALLPPPKPKMPTVTNGALNKSGSKRSPTSKSLGLTPATDALQYSDDDDGEADREVDEEAMYAELGNKLTFEHNGEFMSLNSQADLEAWKTERKRNWPTQRRMAEKYEEKCRVGEERRRLLASARELQPASLATAKKDGGPGTDLNLYFNEREQAAHLKVEEKAVLENETELERTKREFSEQRRTLEDLRKKVSESQARNREAKALDENETSQPDARIKEEPVDGGVTIASNADNKVAIIKQEAIQPDEGGGIFNSFQQADSPEDEDEENGSDVSDENSICSSPVSTSSSSAEGFDSAPEEISSKPTVTPNSSIPIRVCKYFAASGKCRDGDACRFKHAGTAQQSMQPNSSTQQRINREARPPVLNTAIEKKGIFQRLVEQEQASEDRLALQVIKHLGKSGFFSAASTMGDHNQDGAQ